LGPFCFSDIGGLKSTSHKPNNGHFAFQKTGATPQTVQGQWQKGTGNATLRVR